MDPAQVLPRPPPPPASPWGFGIYRTVYTPESDKAWDSVIEELESNMRARSGDEEGPLRNFQRCDRIRFDGATIDQVRNAFRHETMQSTGFDGDDLPAGGKRTRSRGTPAIRQRIDDEYGGDDNCMYLNVHHGGCILIDEEVLQSILEAPSVNEGEQTFSMSSSLGHVKLVFSDKVEPEYAQYDGYGWVRVDLATLGDVCHGQNLYSMPCRPDPETGAAPIITGFSWNSIPYTGPNRP